MSRGRFLLLACAFIVAAILRSAITTRLDGYTYDEAYHITAGVSYVKLADFRMNPEHPPLVKLWVGGMMALTGYHLSELRPFADKIDERNFAEEDGYYRNDFHSVQRRARIAMFAFNGLLLLALGLAARSVFGPGVALGILGFLCIDPTVAANFPLVMTDLPVSLLSTTAILLAIRAFQGWRWPQIAACAAATGLDLSVKHSAPIILLFVLAAGFVMAFRTPQQSPDDRRLLRFVKSASIAVGALIVLWACYFFRYSESREPREVFNRPLEGKISDVNSPLYRAVLKTMAATHVVPRAYTWGFADTIRAGLEGRPYPVFAFGKTYIRKAPFYFFPGMIALKLPIGLDLLVLAGVALFFARRLSPAEQSGLALLFAALLLFLFVLIRGSTYAGIRHGLPLLVMLSVFGGVAIATAWNSKSRLFQGFTALATLAAIASAVPVVRPWEYFNEIIGGRRNAYHYFADEGVDVWQRGAEMVDYYHRYLEPAGEIPYMFYDLREPELIARKMDWVGKDPKRDEVRQRTTPCTGTIFIKSNFLQPQPFWDSPAFRATPPTDRRGNLLIYRGTFPCGGNLAPNVFFTAELKMHAGTPDYAEAERLMRIAIALDPSANFQQLELGNLCLRRGDKDEALQAYRSALENSVTENDTKERLREQIKRVSTEPLDQIPELRNPFTE